MLQKLINYTLLADRKVIDTFLDANMAMQQAEYLFSHVMNAQHIWTKRVLREDPEYDVFQIHTVGEYENIHLRNSDSLLQIIRTRDAEEQLIYTNSRGEQFVNTISDILLHVINHSTYHRGQIATQFRLNGITPPSTDYILFRREGVI